MRAKVALGIQLTDEERAQLPTRVHVGCGPTRTKTFIYAMNAGPFILPLSAYQALMELEPDGHVFHEVEAVHDDISLGPHFLQLEAPVVDCVDIDETIFQFGGRAYYEEVMARPHGPGGGAPRISLGMAQRISLIAAAIAGRHWWRTPPSFSWTHFCSARLVQRWKAANIAGVQFQQCFVSKRPG